MSIPAPALNRTIIPPPEPTKAPPKKGSSGEHRAVRLYRAKLESIKEGTFPELEALNAKLAERLPPNEAPVAPTKRDEE